LTKLKKGEIAWIISGILIVVLIAAYGVKYLSNEPQKNEQSRKDLEAIHFVQNYAGKDNSGSTVTETISLIITLAHKNEDIVNNPSTSMGWDSLRKLGSGPNVYDVYFDFKTYDGSREFHFVADLDKKEVWAGNVLASDILKVVENEQ
jgi:hypothetical protein